MAGNRKDSPVAGKRDLKRQILARWQLYLLLLLPLIYIAVFAYVPMGGLVIAFKKYNVRQGIWGSAWVGLDNFVKFFTSYKFPIIMKNTLMISLYSLAVSFPIPIIFALLLNAMLGKRYKKAIQTIVFYLDRSHGGADFPGAEQPERNLWEPLYDVYQPDGAEYSGGREAV